MTLIFRFTVVAALAAAAAAGCGRSTAEIEASERESSAYRNAEADYKAGRLDEAIAGFEKTVRTVPEAASAHFQLAVLLQDHKKDYIGAIAHYREYVAMRPKAGKSAVAEGRIAMCRKLLANELAPSAGVQADAGAVAAKDKRISEISAQNAKLKKENATLARKAALLEERTATLSRELKSLASGEKPGSARTTPASLPPIPTEKELLADDGDDAPDISAEARKLGDVAKDGGPVKERAASLDEARALLKESEKEDAAPAPKDPGSGKAPASARAGASHPLPLPGAGKKPAPAARPKTYVMKPGESLMSVARRFYGHESAWKRIQQTNKTKISTDGKVNAGERIVLP